MFVITILLDVLWFIAVFWLSVKKSATMFLREGKKVADFCVSEQLSATMFLREGKKVAGICASEPHSP